MSGDYSHDLSLLLDQVDQLSQEGSFTEAIELASRVRDLARECYGEGSYPYSNSLNRLVILYWRMGDYAAAVPLCRQNMELCRAELGERHPVYAGNLHNLAMLYRAMSDYAAALPLYRQALEIRRAALGEGHPDYADSLNSLAALYDSMGDYAAALPLYREALQIRRATLGEGHPDYAQSLSNLAVLEDEIGNYAAAEPLHRQALEIRRAALGEGHPDYADSLNSLAKLYWQMGDYAAALPLYHQALEIRRATLGKGHPDYAQSLNNLAALEKEIGNYAVAEPLYRQALEIWRAAVGEGHRDYAVGLHNLAGLYRSMGDYAAAEPLYRQALEIWRAAVGEGHPDYAATLSSLALLYCEMGDYAAAEPLLRQALEISRAALGEGHPDYAAGLHNLALLSVAMGHERNALALMQKAEAIDDRMIGQFFSIGSEQQRAGFLEGREWRTYLFLSLVLNHLDQSHEAVLAALDLALRRKALGAEGLAVQRDAVLGGRYPHLQLRLRELHALRAKIVQKTLAGPGPEGASAHHRQLAAWAGQRDELEKDLARQIPEMSLEQNLRAADRRAVAQGLPDGVGLVEFVRFHVCDFKAVHARGEDQWKPARYAAFVLRADEPDAPRLIDLGEAEPIDRLIASFRASILAAPDGEMPRDMIKRESDAVPRLDDSAGHAVRDAVLAPLMPALGESSQLLLSPDGALTFLPFEVLPGENGRRLIDDYRISYVTCGRDVLRFAAESTGSPESPLVMADPDFDLERVVATVGAKSARPGFWSRLLGLKAPTASRPEPSAQAAIVSREPGRRSRDLNTASFHFDRLPGTKGEGDAIGRLLGVTSFMDAAALEGRLKSGCRSPKILHLATHGFFLHDQPHDPNRERLGLMGELGGEFGRLRGPLPENPMLRSGLALAGANTWLKGGAPPEAAEDGLLTAEDVTGLDLLSTELVVLSACETGLGDIQVGEGVFGLRRAFVLAGAKTLVMSLWKVPDEPTRELMEDFYHRLLAGEGRAEALRQAQLTLRAKYPDPLFWGAFICQGDPSPLP
jgi:CHAT domain-containing protein/tetratricopeptide (TPR) repeat protein